MENKSDLTLNTLEGVEPEELAGAFNASFAGYFVPVSLSADRLQAKMRQEGIVPALSAGAFHDGRLVGFALHATDGKVAWNGGTGVIPEFRGRGLTAALYAHLIPRLREKGITRVSLEVIDRNMPAVAAYRKIGFEQTGLLGCYRDRGTNTPSGGNVEVKIQETRPADRTAPSGECVPAWQNSDAVIARTAGVHCLEARMNGRAVGYLAFRPDAGLVYQFAVDKAHRRRGIGTALFRSAGKASARPLSIINAPEDNDAVAAFLKSMGMELFLTQLAMELDLRRAP